MTFWHRRSDGRVYIFKMVNGKQKAVSRNESRHLDGRDDTEIERFVASLRPATIPIQRTSTAKLESLLKQFLDYLSNTKKLNPATVAMRKNSLERDVFPFFLSQSQPEPYTWPNISAKLLEYYVEKDLSNDVIVQNNTALKAFWNWMRDENIVPQVDIRLRRPRFAQRTTVLKFTLTPEEVLAFARNAEPWAAFIALTGFFFSLRTQETLALTRNDFKAGSSCSMFECSRVMKRAGLFDRFLVNISKQNSRTLKNKKATPKANSRGWVACFDSDAAKMLITLIKTLSEDVSEGEPLLSYGVDYNLVRWREKGLPGVTMKDLRRASLYYLGHYSRLGVSEIKNHARHAQMKTTELYLRVNDLINPTLFELSGTCRSLWTNISAA